MDPWVTLRDEYYILQEELLQLDTPIIRRNFVRSACTSVEGTLNYLLMKIAEVSTSLSDVERLAFQEKQISVNENGNVKTVPYFIKTKTKIKMMFNYLTSRAGKNKIDLSDNNFQKLISSFKVRDRLMHPRTDLDLEVSETQVQNMIDGFGWYMKNYQGILKAIVNENG